MARTRYRTFVRRTTRGRTPSEAARNLWQRPYDRLGPYFLPADETSQDGPPTPETAVVLEQAIPYTAVQERPQAMTPITHATLYDHPQFAAVLAQALTLARAKMPQFCGRLELAGALVGARAVTPGQGGTATVQSQSDPARTYHVSDHCTCDDAHYQAPEGWCKHRLAMALVTRVRQALQRGVDEANHCQVAIDDEGAPCEAVFAACPGHTVVAPGHAMAAPQGTALPEAPASVNVRVLLHGREVQLTLRDTDETRLLARLEAVLRQLPAEAPVSQILTPAHVAQTAAAPPMCKHHGAMKESSKAPGTWYCPKKLADGTYCTERWPAKRVA